MRFEIKVITPKYAKALLESNKSNRKISKPHVSKLVRSMTNGEWSLTHQGIAIYDDGDIADGQHRLSAIVESGVSCEMMICYGVKKDSSAMLGIDCGKSRTVTDSSDITGNKVTAKDVSIAKSLEFGMGYSISLTHKESVDLVEKHAKAISGEREMLPKNKGGISILPVRLAVAEFSISGCDLIVLKEFCRTLYSGEYENPIMANAVKLRNKLLSNKYRVGAEHVEAYRLTKNAIKATYENKIIKRIRS